MFQYTKINGKTYFVDDTVFEAIHENSLRTAFTNYFMLQDNWDWRETSKFKNLEKYLEILYFQNWWIELKKVISAKEKEKDVVSKRRIR